MTQHKPLFQALFAYPSLLHRLAWCGSRCRININGTQSLQQTNFENTGVFQEHRKVSQQNEYTSQLSDHNGRTNAGAESDLLPRARQSPHKSRRASHESEHRAHKNQTKKKKKTHPLACGGWVSRERKNRRF